MSHVERCRRTVGGARPANVRELTLCSGIGHGAADLTEYRADAGCDARHNGARGDGDKARH